MKIFAVATLFLALATPSATLAGEPQHPIFTTAETEAGWWTGYRASIQVRPLTFAVWPGGFTSDHLFVQNGLMTIPTIEPDGAANPGALYAFAWATHSTDDGSAGVVPFNPTIHRIHAPIGSSLTFELAWHDGRATFRYRDATGWHVQGSWASKTHLAKFVVSSEYWATGPTYFTPQVVRDVQIRVKGIWRTPPVMFFGPEVAQCGHANVTSKTPGSLVFRSAEGPCQPYQRLW